MLNIIRVQLPDEKGTLINRQNKVTVNRKPSQPPAICAIKACSLMWGRYMRR